VREAVGLTAYRAGQWQTAIGELRAYHRITGRQTHLAILADCERALGRSERAVDMYRAADRDQLSSEEAVELLIVAAGARADLGQRDAAVAMLQVRELTSDEPWVARLRYAYADALLAVGRGDEAREWFARAAEVDEDAATDATERLLELDGVVLDDSEDDDDLDPDDAIDDEDDKDEDEDDGDIEDEDDTDEADDRLDDEDEDDDEAEDDDEDRDKDETDQEDDRDRHFVDDDDEEIYEDELLHDDENEVRLETARGTGDRGDEDDDHRDLDDPEAKADNGPDDDGPDDDGPADGSDDNRSDDNGPDGGRPDDDSAYNTMDGDNAGPRTAGADEVNPNGDAKPGAAAKSRSGTSRAGKRSEAS
jgi:tetratricopeptide (TPR) repeat protein